MKREEKKMITLGSLVRIPSGSIGRVVMIDRNDFGELILLVHFDNGNRDRWYRLNQLKNAVPTGKMACCGGYHMPGVCK
jgi:hypothetical protein